MPKKKKKKIGEGKGVIYFSKYNCVLDKQGCAFNERDNKKKYIYKV